MTGKVIFVFCLPFLSGHSATVTFATHVAPILFEYCAPCHRPHEAAPFSLLSYEDARRHASQIVRVTERRYMPPWPPDPAVGDFVGARRLTEGQISVIGPMGP